MAPATRPCLVLLPASKAVILGLTSSRGGEGAQALHEEHHELGWFVGPGDVGAAAQVVQLQHDEKAAIVARRRAQAQRRAQQGRRAPLGQFDAHGAAALGCRHRVQRRADLSDDQPHAVSHRVPQLHNGGAGGPPEPHGGQQRLLGVTGAARCVADEDGGKTDTYATRSNAPDALILSVHIIRQ